MGTLCVGQAFGNAALILASGTKGKRASLPNACIITCAPRINRSFGKAVHQMIRSNCLLVTTTNYIETLAKFTGKSNSDIEHIIRRKKYWTPETAIDFGIIDRIITIKI